MAATTVHQRAVRNEPEQDQELADEAVEAGDADRREHHDREHAGEDGRHLLEAVESAMVRVW